MIDIFLKLVDKIIDLLEQKKHNKAEVFKNLIEPLYNEMPLVFQDYLSLFREAFDSYNAFRIQEEKHEMREEPVPDHYKTELNKIINKIRWRREELLHSRIKIREMADLLRQEYDDELIIEFADRILQFFYSSKIQRMGTTSGKLVELFELLESFQISEYEVIDYITQAQRRFVYSWSEITRTYGMLRIKYLELDKI